MSTDVITELDMLDVERAAALAMVECGECGSYDRALNMITQADGEHLCAHCDDSYRRWAR